MSMNGAEVRKPYRKPSRQRFQSVAITAIEFEQLRQLTQFQQLQSTLPASPVPPAVRSVPVVALTTTAAATSSQASTSHKRHHESDETQKALNYLQGLESDSDSDNDNDNATNVDNSVDSQKERQEKQELKKAAERAYRDELIKQGLIEADGHTIIGFDWYNHEYAAELDAAREAEAAEEAAKAALTTVQPILNSSASPKRVSPRDGLRESPRRDKSGQSPTKKQALMATGIENVRAPKVDSPVTRKLNFN